jgi:hypothetical protein
MDRPTDFLWIIILLQNVLIQMNSLHVGMQIQPGYKLNKRYHYYELIE